MWLLIAFFILLLGFFYLKREEYRREHTQDTPTAHKTTPTHSVVTDVVQTDVPPPPLQVAENADDDADKMGEKTPRDATQTTLNDAVSSSETEIESANMSVYQSLFTPLEKDHDMALEWHLFDTEAAFFWQKEAQSVSILCCKSFTKGKANNPHYEVFHFDLIAWRWQGASPKGAATQIKKQLTYVFKEAASDKG